MAGVVPALLAAPERGPTREAFRQPLRAAGLSEALCDWLLTNLGPDAGGYRWRIDRPALAAFIRRANAEDLWRAVEDARPYRVRAIRGGHSPYLPDADVRRLPDYPASGADRLVAFGYTRGDAQLATLWLGGEPPAETNDLRLVDVTLPAARLAEPLYIDLLTGIAYRLPADHRTASTFRLPLYDSPILLADRAAVSLVDG